MAVVIYLNWNIEAQSQYSVAPLVVVTFYTRSELIATECFFRLKASCIHLAWTVALLK